MKVPAVLTKLSVKRYLKWTLFAALAGPFSIVLHEIGHALMALALGYSHVRVTYHSVDRIAPVDIQPWEKALTSEAGPIVSLMIIFFCFAVILIRRHSIFAKALGIIAAVQFTGGLVYVIGALFGAHPPTDFDGARFAQYVNIPVLFPAIIEALLAISSWIIFVRLMDPSERKQAVPGVISGGILGIFVWLTLLGPLLLP